MKNTMKKQALVAVFAMLVSFAGFAQQPADKAHKTPEQRAEMMTKRMQQELNLTEAQTQGVYEVNLNMARKKAEMRQQASQDKAARQAQMKPVRDEYEARLNAILTPEQNKKREELKQERKDKMKEHKASHRYGKHGEHPGKGKGLEKDKDNKNSKKQKK